MRILQKLRSFKISKCVVNIRNCCRNEMLQIRKIIRFMLSDVVCFVITDPSGSFCEDLNLRFFNKGVGALFLAFASDELIDEINEKRGEERWKL